MVPAFVPIEFPVIPPRRSVPKVWAAHRIPQQQINRWLCCAHCNQRRDVGQYPEGDGPVLEWFSRLAVRP